MAPAPAIAKSALGALRGRGADAATRWLLAAAQGSSDVAATALRFTSGVAAVAAALDTLLAPEGKGELDRLAASFAGKGAPKDLAGRVAALDMASAALDFVRIAEPKKLDVAAVGRVYFAIGARLGLDWLRAQAQAAIAGGRWSKLAFRSLMDEIDAIQAQLAGAVIGESGVTADPDAAITAWASKRQAPAKRARDVIADIRSTGRVDLAMLAVAARQLRALAEG